MPDTKKETIYETILKVRNDIAGSIDKDGQVSGKINYKYATHNNIIHHVRAACIEHQLLIIPCGLSEAVYSKDDTVISGNFKYKLIDEHGDFTEAVIFASGYDYGDKHAYKLDTGALKYLHIQLFMLATDLDPENPKHEPKKEKPKDVEQLIRDAKDIEDLTKVYNDHKVIFDNDKTMMSKLKTREALLK